MVYLTSCLLLRGLVQQTPAAGRTVVVQQLDIMENAQRPLAAQKVFLRRAGFAASPTRGLTQWPLINPDH